MATCPKCFKPNPGDAAFCGFCGAQIPAPAKAAKGEAPAKTMFGFGADVKQAIEQQKAAAEKSQAEASQPKPAAPTPAAAPAPAPAPAAPAAAAPDGGTTVGGRYQLQGEGVAVPTGTLFSAMDPQQNQPVELLMADPSVFQSPLDTERARRELRQLQKVQCDNLLPVLDHGKSDDDRLFIVHPPLQGASLQQRLDAGPLPLAEAQSVVQAVGNALAEAQKVGVIHRDIGPHNVILAEGGKVVLRGFAVAPAIKAHVYGTAAYVSPEQAAGRPVDQRSNIYSLGCLLYAMLVGQPPFSGSDEELLDKQQKEEPQPPNQRKPDLGLPPQAEALVLKALAKSSSRRHLTLRQFLRELESMASADQAAAAPAPAAPMSFETPLHGVTALTGGASPPSSEMQPVKVPAEPADAPAQEAPAADAPSRMQATTGEVSSAVELKQPEPAPDPPPQQQAAAEQPPAGAQPQKGGKGFRETMWFYKGEVESQMAEEGDEEVSQPADGEPLPEELAEKYADDGSLSDDAARRLSLRTGKTQMMQQVDIPKGQLPGEQMADKEMLGEFSKSKTYLWIIIAVVVLVGGGLAAYFIFA